jgi:imidazole glycerol-phosphate synthase subunit HisF
MLTKRIIPCLDVKDGMTVKGVNFENLRSAGDAVALGALYAAQGADELTFLDITATLEGRSTFVTMVQRVAEVINIPFTVGGGIRSVQDVATLLQAGADKISINSSAVQRPELITELANEFGSQCVVVAIDIRSVSSVPSPPDTFAGAFAGAFASGWQVVMNAGKKPTELDAVAWAREAEARGAGEILLTSMDNDGTKAGFALDITRSVAQAISIPVIASGGAGTMEHFAEVLAANEAESKSGYADAALAASLFHFGELTIPALKSFLSERGLPMRL